MPRIGGFFVGPMQSTLNDSGARVGARIRECGNRARASETITARIADRFCTQL